MTGVLVVAITKNSHSLLENYNILGRVTLEDFLYQPSSSFYKFLKSIKKSKFDGNDRIVFDNFIILPEDLVTHIHKILKDLDIPEFFIIIVTNQSTTVQNFSNIKCLLIENNSPSSDTKKKIIPLFNNNDFMCGYAWSGVYLMTDGSARVCCINSQSITKEDGTLYNIKHDSLEDMLHSQWMKDLRTKFRNNERADGCEICWRREDSGQESRRTTVPYVLENIYGDINWEGDGELMFLGGHLGNLCNLKCRICGPGSSSSIANEYLEQIPIKDRKSSDVYKILKDREWALDESFWQIVRDHASQIKNYELLGGEPFMIKQITDFLFFLINNHLSQDTMFYFSTNGTAYPKFLDLVSKFNRIEITFSIDNLNERFELERANANWVNVESNIDKLIALQTLSPNHLKLDVCVSVGIQNVFYLPELINWIRSKRFNSYFLNLVDIPEYYSITNLTDQAKQLVLHKLTTAGLDIDDKNKISGIIKLIESSKTSDGKEFCSATKRLDLLRNENFALTHPEIAKAMGYD